MFLKPRFRRHPERALGGVLVAGLQECFRLIASDPVGLQLAAEVPTAFLEGVFDVLEEDQPEDDVLVLAGVHRATQLVGGLPQHVLEAQRLGFAALFATWWHKTSDLVEHTSGLPMLPGVTQGYRETIHSTHGLDARRVRAVSPTPSTAGTGRPGGRTPSTTLMASV